MLPIALLILAAVYVAAICLFNVRIAGSVPGFLAVSVAFAVLAASTEPPARPIATLRPPERILAALVSSKALKNPPSF